MVLPFLIALLAPAGAADPVWFSLTGAPEPGASARVAVITAPGQALPQVEALAGTVLAVTPWSHPGVLLVDVLAPSEPIPVVLQARQELVTWRWVLHPAPSPGPGLRVPEVVEGSVSEGAVTIVVTPEAAPLDPGALQLAVGEGEVVGRRALSDGGVELTWVPGPARTARVVPIGVRDGDDPRATPVWTQVRLKARASIPVQTEPGASVTVNVRGRVYGPAVADASGRAEVVVEVRPGERTATALLADAAGSRQSFTLSLGSPGATSLVALAHGPVLPGRPAPPVYLHALDEDGQSWSGGAPSCVAVGLGELAVAELGPARWVARFPDLTERPALDLRVDCALERGTASTALRVPLVEGVAERIGLRVYPEEVTADLPVAQIQATVEDAAGDRIAPVSLFLDASAGEIRLLEVDGAAVRADYLADPTVPVGTITARWYQPVGAGRPWELLLGASVVADGLEVVARAEDRVGRPLAGVAVEVGVDGDLAEAVTDEHGRALRLVARPGGPSSLVAKVGDLERRQPVVPWAPPPAPPAAATLLVSQEVQVRAGRVRTVELSADPPLLVTGTGQSSKVRVRLLDQAGRPVTDEAVELKADVGRVGPARFESDGSLVADYTPPAGLEEGMVELTARSLAGGLAGSTRLELVRAPVRWTLSVAGGYLVGSLRSPSGRVALAGHLPRVEAPLWASVGFSAWGDARAVTDAERGSVVDLRMVVVAVDAGLATRLERGRWSLTAGGALVLAPYSLTAAWEDSGTVRAWGLHLPGASVAAGAGWRLGGGEAVAGVRGVALAADPADVGYLGRVGGVAGELGYRLLF